MTKPVPFNAEEQLPDFDWNQLYRRFEDRLQSCEAEEAQLSEDLNRLMAYFNVWLRSTQHHEPERLHKRIRTRMAHVQMSEDRLEESRQHYLEVIQAFKSALDLLRV